MCIFGKVTGKHTDTHTLQKWPLDGDNISKLYYQLKYQNYSVQRIKVDKSKYFGKFTVHIGYSKCKT